nr:GNAT family N-acetyltransferase [Clostridium cavendishii]
MKTEGSRYSTEYITVAEKDEQILGAMILIPYDKLDRLSMKTDFKQLKKMYGISEKIYYMITRVKYMLFRECRRGNLYIANIATDETARGLGVGKKLMKYAEQVAKKEEYDGISLLAKNENVSKFYEKLDYKKVFDKVLLGERIIKMAKYV